MNGFLWFIVGALAVVVGMLVLRNRRSDASLVGAVAPTPSDRLPSARVTPALGPRRGNLLVGGVPSPDSLTGLSR